MSSVQNKSQSALSSSFLMRPTSRDQTNGASATMSSKVGSVPTWGTNIWKTTSAPFGSAMSSTASSRDGVSARDTALKPLPNDSVEGKTGSGALVESSVSDDSWYARPPSFTTNKIPERAAMDYKPSDANFGQPRETANQAYGGASRQSSVSTFSSRHAPVSLNSSNGSKAPFVGAFEASHTSTANLNEAPQVYTKHSHQYIRPADSAWGDGPALHSPTEERKSSGNTYFGIPSQPASRNNSLPPSRHSDVPPQYPVRDFLPETTQAVTHRNNSVSGASRTNNGTTNRFDSPMTQMSTQFGQVNINGNKQGSISQHRASVSHYSAHPLPYSGTSPSATRNVSIGAINHGLDQDELDDVSRNTFPANAFLGQGTPDSVDPRLAQADGRYHVNGATSYPRQATYYPGSAASHRTFDPGNSLQLTNGFGHSPHTHAVALEQKLRQLPEQYQGQQFGQDPRHLSLMRQSPPTLFGQYSFHQGGFTPGMSMYTMQLPANFAHGLPMGMGVVPGGVMPGMDMSMIPRGPRDHVEAGHGVRSQLLEDFKQNAKTNKRYDLKDIYDHVVEFSGDQHGSRFIQLKLESANSDEKERIFREIQPNALQLMTDVFGNYVIQKFFEHGDQMQKKVLANKMRGQVRQLSLQMYGCRVVQKALDHILNDQQAALIRELKDDVLKCVKDQNGNHVIQKAIERCDPKDIDFIFNAFANQVNVLSVHTYGCRVIQRCLEHCELSTRQAILRELQDGMPNLIGDAFGNYVVQHVVEHGEAHDKQKVLDLVIKGLETHSKHKFASNVVEQCLTHASDAWRREVLNIIVQGNKREGEGMLIGCIRDNYGNYVIQKLLDVLNQADYYMFISVLTAEMNKAKRSGCGKQVIAIEKKMHRFGTVYGSMSSTNHNSAATTPPPPPLTSDTRSAQTSAVASINGDAVEGAIMVCNGRKGSVQSSEPAVFEYSH